MPFPIDEKYIQQAEQQLGFIFPMSFKSKMQQLNGGEVIADDDQWLLFPFLTKPIKSASNEPAITSFMKPNKRSIGLASLHMLLRSQVVMVQAIY